jgi:hypothetical protein
MIEALDGPSKQFVISVDDVTPLEVKDGASTFSDRKAITMQGDARFYVYFCNEGEVPTATDISSKGFRQFKLAKETYEAGEFQAIYVLSVSGTCNIRVAERA